MTREIIFSSQEQATNKNVQLTQNVRERTIYTVGIITKQELYNQL